MVYQIRICSAVGAGAFEWRQVCIPLRTGPARLNLARMKSRALAEALTLMARKREWQSGDDSHPLARPAKVRHG